MKTRLVIASAVFACLLLTSCGKEKNCNCNVKSVDKYATVTNSKVVMNVDGNMNCEDIKEVGDQWMSRDGYTSSRNEVVCEEAN